VYHISVCVCPSPTLPFRCSFGTRNPTNDDTSRAQIALVGSFGAINAYSSSWFHRTSRSEIGRNGGRHASFRLAARRSRILTLSEALAMASVGATLGVGWASLGTHLSSLIYERNPHAAMAIKAVFLLIASFVHGYVRLSTPRLFLMVLLMILPVLIGLVYSLLCREIPIIDCVHGIDFRLDSP